jgi:hypothetical protein
MMNVIEIAQMILCRDEGKVDRQFGRFGKCRRPPGILVFLRLLRLRLLLVVFVEGSVGGRLPLGKTVVIDVLRDVVHGIPFGGGCVIAIKEGGGLIEVNGLGCQQVSEINVSSSGTRDDIAGTFSPTKGNEGGTKVGILGHELDQRSNPCGVFDRDQIVFQSLPKDHRHIIPMDRRFFRLFHTTIMVVVLPSVVIMIVLGPISLDMIVSQQGTHGI